MARDRVNKELLVAICSRTELAPGLREILRDIISRVTTALRPRFQAADIEDAIAEALLLLAQNPAAYKEGEGSLEGFVYIVSRNIAAKRVRVQSSEIPTDPRLLLQTADGRQAALEQLETDGTTNKLHETARRRRRTLAVHLKNLAPEQQSILLAFAGAKDGAPWATEHARRTGDDPNRVRVCLHRLIRKLRKDLGER
jgi:DNA-directed RNA polymerase specialized sigma24 family protein